MSRINRHTLVLAAAACFSVVAVLGTARAESLTWQTDFEAAKTQAKTEKKFLLVDFTGSDWCIWCQKLKKEVFDNEPFQTEAPKQFVLVELDFPQAKKLPDDLKEQNQKLAKQYKTRGFPTVLILDPDGKVIAQTGYLPGGSEHYQKHLTELVDVYQNVTRMRGELAKAEGLDRAKLLDQIIDGYGKLENESDDIPAWSKEIIALDADNKAGLKTKQQARLSIAELTQLKGKESVDKAKAIVEQILALPGVTGQQKQDAYFAEGLVFFNQHDLSGTVDCLNSALAADPESSKLPRSNQ